MIKNINENKILKILYLINNLIYTYTFSDEQFTFDITELVILQNGDLIKGYERGEIKTNEGIIINADEFEYNRVLNILIGKGNVQVKDLINNYYINAEKITYFKNLENRS